MSTNLIYNGDFSQPQINSNGSLVYTSFSVQQANQFYWTCNNLYVFSLSGNLFNTNSNINNNYYNKSYVDSLYKTSSTTTNLITTNYFISQFP